MKRDNKIKTILRPYTEAMPDILNYQIVTKALICIWLFLLGRIFQVLLRSSGRVAVTSGDWKFLFTTWQGILILLLGLASLFIYVAFDLNSKIVLSRNLITGRKATLEDSIREGFLSIGKMINAEGILVVLYIALIAPILGIGISISATEKLYIPTFISSVIESSVLYSALAGIAVLVFLSAGVANLFILHGVVIDDLRIGDAGRQSRRLIKANWKDYVKQNIIFILLISGSLAGVAIICLFIPLKLITLLPAGPLSRLLTILFVSAGTIISVLADLFGIPLYILKMTQLFYSYKQGSEYSFNEIKRDKPVSYKMALVVLLAAVAAGVLVMYIHFDQFFPLETEVKVIAHRAGGSEGRENTLSGLEAAWAAGAYGSEIDIQRTKDGYYVLNHDGTFKRVAGDSRKPEEMTLREVKKLSVDGEPVPTFEEMLISSRGRMVLFTELKGNTADQKMADDAVKLVRQYKMEDEVVLISLKYDVIDYIETNYPDIQTGFLTFASFGKTAALNCDYIGLEEESATTDAIDAVHKEGKKVLVWTANAKGSQKHFLCTEVDGIITDNVSQAVGLASELRQRSDLDRMVDKIKTVL
ncbi:MAG: glycerophosphoryl diester phosphodiesterase membrane domain-containing protein [Mogibacterium sp.]|nr:glycerophosphoryl diester phosphodiesterase membrane domain-containing protein [Mogibacterium sp.]